MRKSVYIPVMLTVTGISSSVMAVEYSVTPYVTATVEASDNQRLTTDPNVETNEGLIVNAGAHFAARTESSSLTLSPSARLSRYSDDGTGTDQDNENFYVNMAGAHRINEHSSTGASFSYARTGTISSELDDTGAIIRENLDRDSINFSPYYTYNVDERNALRFGLGYGNTSYEEPSNALNDGLVDYVNYSGNVSWIRQMSASDEMTLSLNLSRQDPDSVAQTDSVGTTLGYSRQFSDTLTGRVSAGYRKSYIDFADTGSPSGVGETTSSGLLFNASVEKQFERTSVIAGISRSVTPTGNEFEQERDELSLAANHSFSDTLTGNAAIRYFTTTLEGETDSVSTDQLRFETGLSWRMSEFWTLGGGYSYRRRESDTSASTDSNNVFLRLSYTEKTFSLSR